MRVRSIRLRYQQQRFKSRSAKHRRKRTKNMAVQLLQAAYLLWVETGNGHYLLECLAPIIAKRAEEQTRKWRKLRRVGVHDFESELWGATWDALRNYDPAKGYMLWQALQVPWTLRVLNVPRKATKTEDGKWWQEAESYEELFLERQIKKEADYQPAETDVDEQALHRVLVEQIVNHPHLTAIERKLLGSMLESPGESLERLAWKVFGVKQHERVRRALQRIAEKVPHLNPFSVDQDCAGDNSTNAA